jgi:outer membrane lipoprotein-sorting protein
MIRKLLAGFVLALFAVPATAQTVDDIIAKNITARGGLEKIRAIKTLRTTGTMTLGPGIEVPVVIEQKRPNMMRMDVTLQGVAITQAYDGKTGWQINPMQGRKDPEPLPEDALKQMDQQADLDGSPLVDYKAKGSTAELLGKDKVEGADAYKIKLTLKTGDSLVIFIDAERFLEVKIESRMKTRGTEIVSESTVGDYKDVGGIMIAHAMEGGQKGVPQKQKMIIQKVELNAPIEDARFKMPAVK